MFFPDYSPSMADRRSGLVEGLNHQNCLSRDGGNSSHVAITSCWFNNESGFGPLQPAFGFCPKVQQLTARYSISTRNDGRVYPTY